jgi:hypothetical protein
VVLSDRLKKIGSRAFYKSQGAAYIVVPRSVEYIGNAAFSACTYSCGLTTICVYRGSYGEHWAKGKKLSILVIDSLDDIPKPPPAESESNYIAEFVDTPLWADKSKLFVAKLLYGGKVNLEQYISSVAKMPDDVSQFLSVNTKASLCIWRNQGSAFSQLIWASAQHSINGSCMDLLTIDTLRWFTWSGTIGFGVSRWEGTLFKVGIGEECKIVIIARDDDIYYVGCAQGRGRDNDNLLNEVATAANLFGPELIGRLEVWGNLRPNTYGGVSYKAENGSDERLMGEVLSTLTDLLRSMAPLGWYYGGKTGRMRERITDIFCVETQKIYSFISVQDDAKSTLQRLGTYCGEMTVGEYNAKNKDAFDTIRKRESLAVCMAERVAERRAPPC